MNIALFLSGGIGTRIGTDIPKQYIEVDGRPVFFYCMETLFRNDRIDGIQFVADSSWQDFIARWQHALPHGLWKQKLRGFSFPGATRQLSICNGLEDIRKYAADSDYVLIHDAARPMLSDELIARCLDAALEHDGAMPVLPMKDTVYCSQDGRTVGELLDRSTIYAGQAPEVFRLGKYYDANQRLFPDRIRKINGSTEPAVIAGMDVVMLPGDEGNFKITTMADLERFCELIEGKDYLNK